MKRSIDVEVVKRIYDPVSGFLIFGTCTPKKAGLLAGNFHLNANVSPEPSTNADGRYTNKTHTNRLLVDVGSSLSQHLLLNLVDELAGHLHLVLFGWRVHV